MARKILPLSDKQIRDAKPKLKDYKLFDGDGLFLLVTKAGGKLWRLKYRFDDKEKSVAIGSYPAITLAKARELRATYKAKIANGIDIAQAKQTKKAENQKAKTKAANTFKTVAALYLERAEDRLSENYHKKITQMLVRDIYPIIGDMPIADIEAAHLLDIAEIIEDRGAIETAHRALNLIGGIYKFAVAKRLAKHNIAADIDKRYALKTPKVRHYPTITDDKGLKALLLAIDGYTGDYTTKKALQVMPYLFLRPFNIRHLEWHEVDFERKVIDIAGTKMKAKAADKDKYRHIVPLTDTVIKLLREVQQLTGNDQYVFGSTLHKGRPLSDNTLRAALRRMGYSNDEIVPHSFRGIFSTIAHENMHDHGIDSLVIEKQLSHQETNKVKASYNHAQYMPERVRLMQWYSDYLDRVKNAR